MVTDVRTRLAARLAVMAAVLSTLLVGFAPPPAHAELFSPRQTWLRNQAGLPGRDDRRGQSQGTARPAVHDRRPEVVLGGPATGHPGAGPERPDQAELVRLGGVLGVQGPGGEPEHPARVRRVQLRQ